MAMNIMRAGLIGGVGVLLLAANGCTAGATFEEPVELGSTTQALDDPWAEFAACCDTCQRQLDAELQWCRYFTPEDQWCGQSAEMSYFWCINGCVYTLEMPPEP